MSEPTSSGIFLIVAIQAGFGFVQILLFLVAWLGKRALDRIEKEQQTLIIKVDFTNGTVIRLEEGNKAHYKLDDVRFDDLERRIENEEKRR